MELEIQKYLREGRKCQDGILFHNNRKLKELESEPYCLNIKRHPKYPNLVQFGYDMLDSPKIDPIIRESRGLILDESNNWNVVAFPFKRFFNEGEFGADTIDWSTARVQEKIDGSLIIMYWYGGDWHIATRGSPDASGSVGDTTTSINGETVPLTFRELFWQSAEYWFQGLSRSGLFNTGVTYMWELTSPYNRVVCDYTEVGPMGEMVDGNGVVTFVDDIEDKTGYAGDGSRITLIGARNNTTFRELDIRDCIGDVHYVVKEFPLTNLQEVLEASVKLNPLRQEGFVVVDINFNRIKIKSPSYVTIHHMRDGSPSRRLMEIIKSGESDEMITYKILDDFPAEKKMYLDMKDKVENLILTTESFYDTIKDTVVQKNFALQAIKSPMSGAMFAVRKGQTKSIRAAILSMQTDKILDIIK
jgi:hypothetical protein